MAKDRQRSRSTNGDRRSRIVGRGMILQTFALVYFSVPSQIRNDGEVTTATFDFAGKC